MAETHRFDLKRIQREAAEAPLEEPLPRELAMAIVDDGLRRAGRAPVAPEAWTRWRRAGGEPWEARRGVLAHLLSTTSLGPGTTASWRATKRGPERNIDLFFGSIEPLTAEMVATNAFRQEELLRKWIARVGGRVAGESASQSKERHDQLDYKATMREFKKAERARKKEADRRRKLLDAARKRREAEARAWRE